MGEEDLHDGADHGNIGEAAEARNVDRQEAPLGRERRRPPAFLEPFIAEHDGEPCCQHVDRDARDHLVAALVDGRIAMDQRKADGGEDGEEQADPGRTVDRDADAAMKAAISILPSSPMSTIPERSDQRPAMQARISGTV